MRNRGLGNLIISSTKGTSNVTEKIFPARVLYTILDDKQEPQAFKDNGGWESLGGIFFSHIANPNPPKGFDHGSFAKPLFPNQKVYPLRNEVVYILSLPSSNIQEDVNNISYYYLFPLNVWNSTHHNAIPDPIRRNPDEFLSKNESYESSEYGDVKRISNKFKEIDLGRTFKEKNMIKPLQPYEGDILYEGRWGQSLRFGSTIKNSLISNPWSSAGEDGDSITILRNGQFEEGNESWIPQVEDINKDISAMYLTSNQKIPIKLSSDSYKSYQSPPTKAEQHKGEQIIMNTGRIVLNSKDDHIFLSSKKSINLNSKESFNIDSPKSIIQSSKVLLGDKNATEPLIFGNKFLKDFKSLLNDIVSLCIALETPIGTPVPYTPNLAIPKPAIELGLKAQKMIYSIESYKSKISKTK